MMALTSTSADESNSSSSGSNDMASNPLALRRRRAKGTMATFGQSSNESNDRQDEGSTTLSNRSMQSFAKPRTNQPQHRSTGSSTEIASIKNSPSHSARLALLCCQNVLHYKTRTQLSLCPPGRNRRTLQAAMRTRQRRAPTQKDSVKESIDDGYFRLDRMLGTEEQAAFLRKEEDYLLSTNTFDAESDEEASSGDEDDLSNLDEILCWDQTHSSTSTAGMNREEKYASLREPLFTSPGSDPPNKGQATSGTAGKLPFHHRKIRLFDQVSSQQRTKARVYLKDNLRTRQRRDGRMLFINLKKMQSREKRRLQVERGEIPDTISENDDMEIDVPFDDSVSKFEGDMTPSMSVALLLESLAINPVESVEGMSKCYDGIVAAGVALLDAAIRNEHPSRSEIMSALAPLLITSLDQASGDVILQLSKMRRMCGTARYQRRFVQRVAPCLVRPTRSAIWCLMHQNDMEPILAAVELILDRAGEVFSKGWYDRGQQVLADSARKETLNTAAEQLRNLSADAEGGLGLHKCLALRRQNRMTSGSTQAKDAGRTEPLAEWEVIAVDRQIRISIGNILSMDWSKVSCGPRDSDILSSRRSRSTGSSSHADIRISRSGESTKTVSSPSPLRQKSKSAFSPTQKSVFLSSMGPPPAPENMESIFGPSFVSQPVSSNVIGRSLSPDVSMSPNSLPNSPPRGAHRKTSAPQTPKSNYSDSIVKTPPRSPPSTPAMISSVHLHSRLEVLSPHQPFTTESSFGLKSPSGIDRAPLSPSASISSADVVPHNRHMSSNSSVASVGPSNAQPAHYRMLTSTAAERKRTVAACRALRSQIQRFEEAFMQLHGRPPKGASERSPLATTYAQYREWKRAIRADAACRIQALFRGANTRWLLLRRSNSRLSRVVMIRAGRPEGVSIKMAAQQQSDSVLNRLSIPIEISDEPDRSIGLAPIRSSLVPIPQASTPTHGDQQLGVEVFINPVYGTSATAVSSPTWTNVPPRVRLSGQDRDMFSSPSTPPQYSPPGGSPTAGMIAEMAAMTFPELQARKRELKQQLKQYDMDFARKHGRMPVKAEKEPIRHLYENYNSLKSEITKIEQDGTMNSRQTQPAVLQQPQVGIARPHLSRSTSGSGPDSSGESDTTSPEPGIALYRASFPVEAVPSTPTGTPSQDLSALKAEKGRLHQMLRSYEKDFFKEHKRQVSSFADIKPVASQYRRYKEIKKAIASLHKQGEVR